MPENMKGGRADVDSRVDNLFFNYVREGYVKYLWCIARCQIIGDFTSGAIGMVPEIGMMMKRCHRHRGKENNDQKYRDIYAKCFAIHLQPRPAKVF
jgi:hypothetical protein